MQVKCAFRVLITVLIVASVPACSHRLQAATTPPPAQTLSSENKAKATEVARKLVEQDRASVAAHRAEMDRLIDATVLRISDGDREISLRLRVQNKTNKAITAFDAGLKVYLSQNGRRVGLTELHSSQNVAPQSAVTFTVPIRYVRFGEDTGSMRLAQGQLKNPQVEVTEINYTDGSDAGYDD